MSTPLTVPVYLRDKTTAELRKIICNAVDMYALSDTWKARLPRTRDLLLDHINDMCNEFNLRVASNGALARLVARTYTIEINEQQRELLAKAAAELLTTDEENANELLDDAEREEVKLLVNMFATVKTDPGKPGEVHGFCR